MSMIRVLHAELLKLKRTVAFRDLHCTAYQDRSSLLQKLNLNKIEPTRSQIAPVRRR